MPPELAVKLGLETERKLKLVSPPTEVELNRLLRDFLEGDPHERRALRQSLDGILHKLASIERNHVETTKTLRDEIRGVTARVTILEQAMPAPKRRVSIPPIASVAEAGPDTGTFFLTKDVADQLQKKINEANAAATWLAVKGGAWKLAIGLALLACSGALALLWKRLFG
jgi:hypothetical protein